MDERERARYLDALAPQPLLEHLRVVEPVVATGRERIVTVSFDHVGGPRSTASTDPKYLWAKRELAREARVRLRFSIRFESEPFTLVRIESFMDICQKLVASAVTLQRFILSYFPEQHDRGGTVDPASVILFAPLETEHGEAVHVELCTTEHAGYEDRIVAWVRQRAAELRVPFEQHCSLRKPADAAR